EIPMTSILTTKFPGYVAGSWAIRDHLQHAAGQRRRRDRRQGADLARRRGDPAATACLTRSSSIGGPPTPSGLAGADPSRPRSRPVVLPQRRCLTINPRSFAAVTPSSKPVRQALDVRLG